MDEPIMDEPLPDEPITPAPIFLCGGDEFRHETEDADRYLLRLAPPGYMAAVPTAGADHGAERAALHAIGYFSRLGARVKKAMIVSRQDADDEEMAAILRGASIIYFPGGDPRLIVDIFRDSAALAAMIEARSHGAILAGSSAGAMALGPAFGPPAQGWADGLAITPVVSIPHAEQVKANLIHDVVHRVGPETPVAAIHSASSCLVRENAIEGLGPDAVSIHYHGSISKLAAGERLHISFG